MNTLMVWGDNASRQISDAPDGDLKAVAGGSINGLALRRNGTPLLWGAGPIGPPPIPDLLAGEKFKSVALGRDDAVLIRPNGKLAAFGRNAPVKNVPAGSYDAVTVAAVHAVAIANDGTLTAWGSDSPPNSPLTGLLNAPDGGPSRRSMRVSSTRSPCTRMEASTAIAIRPDGTVTGWGNGAHGALQAPADVKFKVVAAGWGFSIGLETGGTLWGWGTPAQSPFATQAWTFASQGWARYGDTESYYIPDKRFKSIAAAAFHIMAITAGP